MRKPGVVKQIQATTIDGGSVALYYTYTPDYCPRCYVSLYPRVVTGAFSALANKDGSMLQVVFQCTQLDCEEIFIASYAYSYDSDNIPHETYEFVGLAPKNPAEAEFSESVSKVSPTFVKVYDQAVAAEANGLDEITGIGLRKSIEFLIKDFLIHENPSNADAIKKKSLGDCIKQDIGDANVKACAARATWLGNDETHYVRKWVDKDISDLKTLIRLTVNWVDNVLLTEEYLKDMDPSKKPLAASADMSDRA